MTSRAGKVRVRSAEQCTVTKPSACWIHWPLIHACPLGSLSTSLTAVLPVYSSCVHVYLKTQRHHYCLQEVRLLHLATESLPKRHRRHRHLGVFFWFIFLLWFFLWSTRVYWTRRQSCHGFVPHRNRLGRSAAYRFFIFSSLSFLSIVDHNYCYWRVSLMNQMNSVCNEYRPQSGCALHYCYSIALLCCCNYMPF